MKILVLGGTRFFGIHLVNELIKCGHEVTIATRGNAKPCFSGSVTRLIADRDDIDSMRSVFSGREYDVVYDNLAYCSNAVKTVIETVHCLRYIMVSSASVYRMQENTAERDYDPLKKKVVWGDRSDFDYGEGKRQAEAALMQMYPEVSSVMVRFPVVLGRDDYTKRLSFYATHIVHEIPISLERQDCRVCFISSEEAGHFLAFLAASDLEGPVNAASSGVVTVREVIRYLEDKSGKKALLMRDGEAAPYNGLVDFTLNTERAVNAGFVFSDLRDWIFPLLDGYLEEEMT